MKDPRPKDFKESLKEFRRIKKVTFEEGDNQEANNNSSGRPTSTGLEVYSGLWGEEQAAHLLKRTLFGVKAHELNRFKDFTVSQAVDSLIVNQPSLSPPVNDYMEAVQGIESYNSDEDVPEGEDWTNAKEYWPVSFIRISSLKGWWIKNIFDQEANIHQRMILFWHLLIPTQFFDEGIAKLSYQYLKLLQDHALGNYKTLIKEITLNPLMLIYLNGYLNSKSAPDENYARELQELFTIGKGPDANFSESDVYEAARVLTGWRIDWPSIDTEVGAPRYFFDSEEHDVGDKQFSSFYGDQVIEGKEGMDGASETDELLDMIFANEETSLYICRRLYNFFVYHEIDENAEINVVRPLAQIFRENNFEIAPVLKALFQSSHFYEEANIGSYIKSPADHYAGLLRSFDSIYSENLSERYDYFVTNYWLMGNLGMEFGDPPNVSGWQAYYQQPSFDKIWINTDTTTKRAQYQDFIIYSFGDLPRFISTLNKPEDPNELIRESVLLLHGIIVAQDILDGLKGNLLAGQQTDDYWTNAWNQYVNDPADEEYRASVENRLRALFRPLLQLSEFQLF